MKIRWKKVFYFVFLLGSMFGFKNAVGQNEKLILKSKSEENKLEKKYSINGIIFETDSITPIPFCNVSLLNSDSIVIANTFADFDGRFSFDKLIQNNYSITISLIGYQTVTISNVNINENTNLSTVLSPVIINHDEFYIINYEMCYLTSKEPYMKAKAISIDTNLPAKKEIIIEKTINKGNIPNSNEIENDKDIKNMPIRK